MSKSVAGISQMREELDKFVKYLANNTMERLGHKGKGRLKVEGSISYLNVLFTITLDGNTTTLKFPKSEEIINKSVEFEHLFRIVLGRIVKVMLSTSNDYEAEYKGKGNVEFVQKMKEPRRQNTEWWYDTGTASADDATNANANSYSHNWSSIWNCYWTV